MTQGICIGLLLLGLDMKNKEYFYKKEIEVPLYRGLFVIILTNSIDKLNKCLGRDDSYVYCSSFYGSIYKKTEGYIVAFNFDRDDKITYGTVAHEAFHTANFICSHRGFEADLENDESIAYLIEWLTDNIHKFIIKCKFNNKLRVDVIETLK